MARNGTHSKDIEAYFKNNPGKAVRLSTLMKVAKCNKHSVSSAISYLNQKARTGKGGLHIEALTRGQSWAYYPDVHFEEFESLVPEPADSNGSVSKIEGKVANKVSREAKLVADRTADEDAAERLRRLANKLTAPAPDWAEVERATRRDQTHAVIRLVHVGNTTEGYAIGKDEDTGNVFKVVPV